MEQEIVIESNKRIRLWDKIKTPEKRKSENKNLSEICI